MNIGSSFFNNLFGSIGPSFPTIPTNADFIPTNASDGTIKIKGQNAQWLGMRNRLVQKQAYEFCYPVASVIDRLAEYDLSGEIEILRAKGKGKEDLATNQWAVRMNALIEQPNAMQSWEHFRGQQLVYKRVFGFCPVLPIVPVGFGPEDAMAMINIPPWLIDPIVQPFELMAVSLEQVVRQFRINILGKVTILDSNQLFILEDSFIQDEQSNFIFPLSKLVGLDMAISNVCAAMEADNVLLRKKGPLGFISSEAVKDAAGYIPMRKEEKTELQDALQAYGLSWDQYQYVISRTTAKWNSMSFNVTELGTKQTVEAGSEAICQRFGFPYILFKESGATYANGENAMSSVYVNNVIPNAKKDLNKYNKFFKAKENQCKIVACFDDIPALQEDELNKNSASLSLAQTLDIEWKSGIITKNQWLTARGYDTVTDGDVYFTQPSVTQETDTIATTTEEDNSTNT